MVFSPQWSSFRSHSLLEWKLLFFSHYGQLTIRVLRLYNIEDVHYTILSFSPSGHPSVLQKLINEDMIFFSLPELLQHYDSTIDVKFGILFSIPLAALVFSEGGKSAGELYDEVALYTVESLWPNVSTAADVAEIAASFYYSTQAKHDLNVLAEEMTEVGVRRGVWLSWEEI